MTPYLAMLPLVAGSHDPLRDYAYTPSGHIGKERKVVASHAAVARPSLAAVGLIYTMHLALRGYCP